MLQQKSFYIKLLLMGRKIYLIFIIALCGCVNTSPYLENLSCGTDNMWNGQHNQSSDCFDMAEVSDTGGYQVKDYEKIMLKTYSGLNNLALGNNFANQSFRQAYSLQTQVVQDNSDEIDSMQQEFAKTAKNIAGMPSLDYIVNDINEQLDKESLVVAMRDFVNPYTTWLSAIYDGIANKDYANAENYLKRVAEFAPDNKFVKSDINAIRSGKNFVWIVFENGSVGQLYEHALAPRGLRAWNIHLTVPDLARGKPALPYLEVSGERTQFLASMDSIVKTDLLTHRDNHIISSVIFEIGKIAAAGGVVIGTGKATRKNQSSQGLLILGGYMAASTIMNMKKDWDLRSWQSLPYDIQVARINMPASRKLFISPVGEIKIPSDIKNAVVFIRISDKYNNVIIGKLN